MENKYSKTFQMRFDLQNEQDLKISRFLQEYPWSRTQKVKEILLAYIEQNEESKRHPDVPFIAPEK
ncbi:MAG: hypothetical protein WCK35_23610 [Chloroflexota bacterium]